MSHATLPAVVAPPRYGTARVGEKRELSSPTRNSCAEDTSVIANMIVFLAGVVNQGCHPPPSTPILPPRQWQSPVTYSCGWKEIFRAKASVVIRSVTSSGGPNGQTRAWRACKPSAFPATPTPTPPATATPTTPALRHACWWNGPPGSTTHFCFSCRRGLLSL